MLEENMPALESQRVGENDVPDSKVVEGKKNNKGLVVLLCVIIVILGVGFLGYYLLSSQIIKNDLFAKNNCNCLEDDENEDISTAVTVDEGEVVELLQGVKGKIAEQYDHALSMTYNVHPWLGVKVDDGGTIASLDKSYGLEKVFDIDDDWSTMSREFGNITVGFLKDNGFEKYTESFFGLEYYANDEMEIVCGVVVVGGSSWWLDCAEMSWISDEDKELTADLAKAFEEKEGSKVGAIDARTANIKTSIDGKYDTLSMNFWNATGYFYRKKDGGNWVFVLGTQQGPFCDRFEGEAKEAFKGLIRCYARNSSGVIEENLVVLE